MGGGCLQKCLDGLQIICQGKLEVKIDRQCTVHRIINSRVSLEYLHRILHDILIHSILTIHRIIYDIRINIEY